MILIGGKKLLELGSDRHSDDTDYLIYNEENKEIFSNLDNGIDLINAANHPLLKSVWDNEVKNNEITIIGLFCLCAWAFVNHCQNFNWQKADAKEYDIRFLVRYAKSHNIDLSFTILKDNLHSGEFEEILKIVESVKI